LPPTIGVQSRKSFFRDFLAIDLPQDHGNLSIAHARLRATTELLNALYRRRGAAE
jgi:hypothetical protein